MGTTSVPREKELLSVVVVGHVDHGKSTIVGRLLADTGSLPNGKLEQVRQYCERNSKPFEYAFLLDALKDEQSQGITIDAARVFFKTPHRHYVLIDAPGHIEFLKNMITGAARADAAFLVIDAREGVQENSRRHGYLLSFLGIRQVAVVINKMDLVGRSEAVYNSIAGEYREFLSTLKVEPDCFLPTSGFTGENIMERSSQFPWYDGPTLVQTLDRFSPPKRPVDLPFRLPVQDVYKFTSGNDDRRIVAGHVESGRLAPGDTVVFYPSGKKSVARTLERFAATPPTSVEAGSAAGFTLTEQIYLGRGEIASRDGESPPKVAARLRANVFWLGREPLTKGRGYLLRLGTSRTPVQLEEIRRVIDSSNPGPPLEKDTVDRYDVAECVLRLARPVAFDLPEDMPALGRFVIVGDYEIQGGGIVIEGLTDESTSLREQLQLRNFKWEISAVDSERRAEKYNQRASLILITGSGSRDRKAVARALESRLFDEGKIVYFLGIGNVKYGVDADLLGRGDTKEEHLRRLAEVAHILLDVGVLLIVTAKELTQEDVELMSAALDGASVTTVWLGDLTTNCRYDLQIPDSHSDAEIAQQIKSSLQSNGIIFDPRLRLPGNRRS